MAPEKVSEQAASISSIDENNNKQVKLQSPPGCYHSAVRKHFGFKIVTVNGQQVTESEKTVCRRQLQGWEYFDLWQPISNESMRSR